MSVEIYQRSKTHCPRGHAYDEANTVRRPGTGYRHCRTCTQIWKQNRKAKR
jgi:hypothetical protein